MKITQSIWTIPAVFVASITIILIVLGSLNYINMDIGSMFVGISELFFGIDRMNFKGKINSKGANKANKIFGIFMIIVGIAVIINVIIKMMI